MPAPYGARAGGGMRRLRLRRRTFSGCRRPSRPRGVACAIPVVKAEAASATSVDHLVSDPRLKPVGLPGTPLTPGRGARVTHRLVEDTSRLGVVAHRTPGILPASPFPTVASDEGLNIRLKGRFITYAVRASRGQGKQPIDANDAQSGAAVGQDAASNAILEEGRLVCPVERGTKWARNAAYRRGH